jgi:hypothetical protein
VGVDLVIGLLVHCTEESIVHACISSSSSLV